jgi:hypothetical protein
MSASRPARLGLVAGAGLLAAAGLLAGCAPASSSAHSAPATAAPALTLPLETSTTTADGRTWALFPMGRNSDENLFWELFTRLPGGAWKLATPPGVATNGGLVASWGAGSLTVGILPSQQLKFSPFARTGDWGKTSWGTGVITPVPLAGVPGAMAGGGKEELALLANGAIDQAPVTRDGSLGSFAPLAGPDAVAKTASGAQCQVTGLTAVGFTASGTPLAGASCARPGSAGIFALTHGTWHAAGPAVPAGKAVRVLRLDVASPGTGALLQVGTGAGASLIAAWAGKSGRWTLSPALPVPGGRVLASGTAPGGGAWVMLPGGKAATLAGPGAAWRELPALPTGTTALAADAAGTYEAMAVADARLTVYRLTPAGAWNVTQRATVPIQYGSSA